MMGFEFILLVLVCYQAFRHYKSMPDRRWRGARLVNVMVRDSVLYFFM